MALLDDLEGVLGTLAQWIGQTGGLGAAVRVHAVCQAIWERRTLLAHTHKHAHTLTFTHKFVFISKWGPTFHFHSK